MIDNDILYLGKIYFIKLGILLKKRTTIKNYD